jgi:hypothetical protein
MWRPPSTRRRSTASRPELGLDDLERLPAQPCLASRVETGIAIDANDLAFIDAVETQLGEAFGREAVVRCRVTQRGIVIELSMRSTPRWEPSRSASPPKRARAKAARSPASASTGAARRFCAKR